MKIVGLVGGKRAGKDTFYHMLKARGYPVARISFADFIKADCSHLQGLEGVEKDEARPVWQAYGEAVKAAHGSNYWIDRLEGYLPYAGKEDDGYLILTDVRFQHEADWVKANEGYLIKIRRPPASSSTDGHVSEQSWQSIDTDAEIYNSSTRSYYAEAILKEWRLVEQHFNLQFIEEPEFT